MTAKCANFLLGLGLCLTGRAQPRGCDIEGPMNLFVKDLTDPVARPVPEIFGTKY